MTPLETYLASVEEREKQATPGPYYVGHMSEEYDTLDVHESKDGLLIAETVRQVDFNFWNHARTNIPRLLEIIRVQNEALEYIDRELTIPAAEYVPAIPDCFTKARAAIEKVEEICNRH